MNDTANAGAATNAGTPDHASGSAFSSAHVSGFPGGEVPSGSGLASDPFSGLRDAGNRDWVASKGWKALDPLVESARHADRVQAELAAFRAKALTPPGADAPPEEWEAFHARLGRPDKAEDYVLAMPRDLPENLPYDAEGAQAYRQWAHKAGLTPRQAQAVHDEFVCYQASQYGRAEEAGTRLASAAHEHLVRAWGDPASASYRGQVAHADLFIRNNGGDALLGELQSRGLIGRQGEVLSPLLAQAMARAGQVYAEDSFVAGSPAGPARDPARTLYPEDPFRR